MHPLITFTQAGSLYMKHLVILIMAITLISCESNKPTFSLLPTGSTFFQKTDGFNNKIDLLWVIDNSGSMTSAQADLTANFNSFISDFVGKSYDFNMAVITTSAYKAIFMGVPDQSKFRDGTDATSHTGVFVITDETPNIESTFITNVTQGIYGSGDERSFMSIKDALNNSLNAGFLREDSFLAIINVSDEDDFSHPGSGYRGNSSYYGQHDLISDYVTYLDTLTSTSGASKRYSFNSIHILENDTDCMSSSHPSAQYGLRYSELVAATGGTEGSICDNFSGILNDFATNIIQRSTQFYLDRDPIIETIVVEIDGNLITQSTENGWSYNASANSILFHGSGIIPPQGAVINVNFDLALFIRRSPTSPLVPILSLS